MNIWLLLSLLSLFSGPDLTEREAWVCRNLPQPAKEAVWKMCCDAGLASDALETPSYEHFDGVMGMMRRRAIGKPFACDPHYELFVWRR